MAVPERQRERAVQPQHLSTAQVAYFQSARLSVMQRPPRFDDAIANASFARALNRGHCIARSDGARGSRSLLFTPAIRWHYCGRKYEKD